MTLEENGYSLHEIVQSQKAALKAHNVGDRVEIGEEICKIVRLAGGLKESELPDDVILSTIFKAYTELNNGTNNL
jgi:hypothetical protein